MNTNELAEASLRLECLKLAVNVLDKKGHTVDEIAKEFSNFVFGKFEHARQMVKPIGKTEFTDGRDWRIP